MMKRLFAVMAITGALTAGVLAGTAGAESNSWQGSLGSCSNIFTSHGQRSDNNDAYGVTQEIASCSGYVKVRVHYNYSSGGTMYSRIAISSSQAIANAPDGSIARYSYHWVGCDSAGNNCDAVKYLG